ncbi:hypothetical protein Pta6605_45600 [Pseudomonas amygdali pv. tabaci]|nr:hypothetical protein Pta6605_45600 [Pseudomonas amygdali pv. tabaci]
MWPGTYVLVACRQVYAYRFPNQCHRFPPRMDKTYQPYAIETFWYQTWESENYFAPQGVADSSAASAAQP